MKMLAVVLGSSLVLLFGFAFWQSSKSPVEPLGRIQGVEASPDYYELESVPINGGIITREYTVSNSTGETLKLRKISTSCMCTEAKVKIGDRETRLFGMEGHGVRIPPVNLEMQPGEEALVTVNFDPAAHGPQGVGPFERIVWLEFSDPAGIKELKFNGTVVAN